MGKTFKELDANKFEKITEERQRRIDEASEQALPKTYPVNELAGRLHPGRQYMKVEKVTVKAEDTKCYRLVPDTERGTLECAYFQAGQYVNVFLDIEGKKLNRAYSLSSSPKEALEGYYELTVKAVEGGLASTYILDNWKEGDSVEISAPAGFFNYSPIRDAKTVVGIAGGSGITPFLSMARAIVEGEEDFCLTLLYGTRKAEGILCREEFDSLAQKTDKIKVVYVLSDEEKDGYEHGFVEAGLIEKYAPQKEVYSVFLCGPQAMYQFVDKELEKIGLEKKYIRHELFGEIHNPAMLEDYPGCGTESVSVTVSIRDTVKTVKGSVNDTVLQTLEKNGIEAPARCRSGECGFCHSYLKSGKVYTPKRVDGRRLADFKFGYIHPCAAFPLTDIEIEVPAVK